MATKKTTKKGTAFAGNPIGVPLAKGTVLRRRADGTMEAVAPKKAKNKKRK